MMKNHFKPPHPLNTAVLFLVFNRLDVTKQVFNAIKQAKPPRLYIAADGARETKNGEDNKVKAVRDYIISNIDWDCEVKTLFREQNYGCKMAVSGAIDWFFENEEMGIILEDDCLPSQSFFWFCEELLEKYKDDMRIWHISGDNFQNGFKRSEGDYYFSKYNHIWGWASWADRWKEYDVGIKTFKEFKDKNLIKSIWVEGSTQKYWMNIFENTYKRKIDTWDYQWTYTCWLNSGLSILPNVNLIKNIGFGADATHTTNENSEMSNVEYFDIPIPLKHNKLMLPNYEADNYTTNKMFKKVNILQKIVYKLSKTIMKKQKRILNDTV